MYVYIYIYIYCDLLSAYFASLPSVPGPNPASFHSQTPSTCSSLRPWAETAYNQTMSLPLNDVKNAAKLK